MSYKRSSEKAKNLKNIDPELYRLIYTYNINQQYLAEKVFAEEWKHAGGDSKIEQALVGRLRNKLLGHGRLLPAEYAKLQQCLSEIADDMIVTVNNSLAKSHLEKKEKIRKLLEAMDDESLNDLLNVEVSS